MGRCGLSWKRFVSCAHCQVSVACKTTRAIWQVRIAPLKDMAMKILMQDLIILQTFFCRWNFQWNQIGFPHTGDRNALVFRVWQKQAPQNSRWKCWSIVLFHATNSQMWKSKFIRWSIRAQVNQFVNSIREQPYSVPQLWSWNFEEFRKLVLEGTGFSCTAQMRQTSYNFLCRKATESVKQRELLGDVDIRSLSQETVKAKVWMK